MANAKTPGQLAYEAELVYAPTYPCHSMRRRPGRKTRPLGRCDQYCQHNSER
jgi:hypothetical protein